MNETLVTEVLERGAKRRDARRNFLRSAGVLAAGAAGAAALNASGAGLISAAQAQTDADAVSDGDILNFALNLEYLEAQFYSFAAFGQGLPANMLTGKGHQGPVKGGHHVPFNDPLVKRYAIEIAKDEANHVAFLRAALGSAAVAQPTIDIDGTNPNGAFSTAARAAGLVGAGVAFDPYANDLNFLLGAFIFEDVGVTAYHGAAPLLNSKTYLSAAAGILAAEAYHASLVRTTLYAKGQMTPIAISSANAISRARDTLDGPGQDDQGVTYQGMPNIVPLDKNGLAYARTTGQVLNIVYLNGQATTQGGFFPQGVNGAINSSASH
jgi:hypothetical protein